MVPWAAQDGGGALGGGGRGGCGGGLECLPVVIPKVRVARVCLSHSSCWSGGHVEWPSAWAVPGTVRAAGSVPRAIGQCHCRKASTASCGTTSPGAGAAAGLLLSVLGSHWVQTCVPPGVPKEIPPLPCVAPGRCSVFSPSWPASYLQKWLCQSLTQLRADSLPPGMCLQARTLERLHRA